MSDDPRRSDGPPITGADLVRIDADLAVQKLEGRLRMLEGIDAAEGLVEASPSTKAARRDLENVRSARAALSAPLRAPSGTPRRPIDDYDWTAGRAAPITVHVEEGAILRFEFDRCPGWMRETTYQALIDRLTMGIRETPRKPLTRLMAWTARHVWVVRAPRKITSENAGLDELVDVALELTREAKRRGVDPTELGRPTRRRLLE